MALVVIGVVTPVTAVSFGTSSAPPLSFASAAFALVWLSADGIIHRIARGMLRQPEIMNSGRIFVTFVIPAFVITACYLAMPANERAGSLLDRKPPGE